MGRLFGTDGIRGVAGSELTADTGYRLGLALANILTEKAETKQDGDTPRVTVLIGKDPRTSGDMFEAAIAAGLMAGGADANVIGLTTTPAIACLVRELGADAGVMISASHNPAPYNGLKVFGGDGYKPDDADEARVEAMILGEIPMQAVDHDRVGRLIDGKQENERYMAHILTVIQENGPKAPCAKRRILFDLSHGSACATARKVFTAAHLYGFETAFMADTPDGVRINDGCGSTHMQSLSAAVKAGGYDMGFAFDGDADRCLAVDEAGHLIDGDMLIAALALDMKKRGMLSANTAVVTVLTNLAFKLLCEKEGILLAQTDVGDRYVLREMLRIGAGIGGEQSGHIILPAYATTGDGQVTASAALGLLARSEGLPASQVFGVMKPLPQVSVNVTVPNAQKEAVLASSVLHAAAEKVKEALDGRGRLLIRPSGTEALIRIMLEGDDLDEIRGYADALAEKVKDLCGTH